MSIRDWLLLLQDLLLLIIAALFAWHRYELVKKAREDRKRQAAVAPPVDSPEKPGLMGIRRR